MGGKLLYSVNENFFKSWNSKMAYVLGFTFADGSLSERTISWEIQGRDAELLKKLDASMNSNYPIKLTKKNKYVRLRISNPRIIKDLRKFGLSKIKRLREFPRIPENQLNHFIRGFLDGDGWIALQKEKLEICVGFSSSNHKFLKNLIDVLNKKLNLSVNNLRSKSKMIKNGKISTSYQIDWYAENAIKIIKFLYDDLKEDDLFLERKLKNQKVGRELFEEAQKPMEWRMIEQKMKLPMKDVLQTLWTEQKLSALHLAERLNVSKSSIYRWLEKTEIRLPTQRKPVYVICPVCDVVFTKHGPSRYCSASCAYRARLTGKEVNCTVCNKKVYRPAWWFRVNSYPICSKKCDGKWKKTFLERGILQRDNKTGRFVRSSSMVMR